MTPGPGPRFLRALAALLLPARDREVVIGDLEELYARRRQLQGVRAATWAYFRDTFGSILARRFRRRVAPLRLSTLPHSSSLSPAGTLFSDCSVDFRLALRSLRQRPGFSALVVLTLALGIGAATAVFALADQVLLQPPAGVSDPRGAAYLEFPVEGESRAI